MALKDGMQKVISIRLNLAREEEKKLYDEVMSHSRNVPGDIYGSSGAYVKAALSAYGADREKSDREHLFKEQMKEYLEMLSKQQGREFLDKLKDHDEKLTGQIMGVVQNVLSGLSESGAVQMMAQGNRLTAGRKPDQVQFQEFMPKRDTGAADQSGTAGQSRVLTLETKPEPSADPSADLSADEKLNASAGTDSDAYAKGTVITTLDEEPETELPEGALDFLDSFC